MKRIVLFLLSVLVYANTIGQTATRLVAFAGYGSDTTGAPVDTGGYTYTHDRGGEILSTPAPFRDDYPFVFVPTTDFETGHEGIVKSDSSWEMGPDDTDVSTQIFDKDNNIITSTCQIYKDGSWQIYNTCYYEYDANNNLLQETDSSQSSNYYLYAYDSNNQLTSSINFLEPGNDTNMSIGYKSLYIYDATGKLIYLNGIGWDDHTNSWTPLDSIYTSFFYNENQPDSFFDSYLPVGVLGLYYFSPLNDSMVVNYYSNLYGHYLRITNSYDIHHNKVSFTREGLNPVVSYLNNTATEWTYNANNQVTSERNFSIDSSGNRVFTSLNRYYYERYETEVSYGINSLDIFPSPAQNSITIKLAWDKPQPFSVAIFDAAGRRAMQWTVPATQQYEQTISLPFLASGNYFIQAVSGNQKLVKQFVLLH